MEKVWLTRSRNSVEGFFTHMSSFWPELSRACQPQCLHIELHVAGASHSITADFPEGVSRREHRESKPLKGQRLQCVLWAGLRSHQCHLCYILLVASESLSQPRCKGEGHDLTSWWWSARVTMQKNVGWERCCGHFWKIQFTSITFRGTPIYL